MAAMEPTSEELSGFTGISSVIAWSGMSSPVEDSFLSVLGRPPNLRVLASVPVNVFRTMIDGWRLPPLQPSVESSESTGVSQPTMPTPTDIATSFLVFQAARLKMGLPFAIDQPALPSPATPRPAAPAAPSAPIKIKMKMNEVINQSMDQEIDVKSSSEMAALTDIYIRKVGAEPDPGEDPTAEQVAGVEKLIENELPPSPDLAIFGPYGAAIHRKLKFRGQIFVNNMFVTQELTGPPNYQVWKACMAVLKIVYIFLETVSPQRFDNYVNFVGSLATVYGDRAWAVIYQADVEMRTQEFARIKARLDRKHHRDIAFRTVCESAAKGPLPIPADPNAYDDQRPWDGVFYKAVSGSKAETFWNNKVHRPGMMMCTNVKKPGDLVHDHNLHPAAGSYGGPNTVGYEDPAWPSAPSAATTRAAPAAAARGRTRTPRGDGNSDLSVRDDQGHFTINRRGMEVCRNFQTGNCVGGNMCPQDPSRVHQCWWCLKQHPGDTGVCPAAPTGTGAPPRDKGGKGKGGKGKKGKGKLFHWGGTMYRPPLLSPFRPPYLR